MTASAVREGRAEAPGSVMYFDMLGVGVRVDCPDESAARHISANFSALSSESSSSTGLVLHYTVTRSDPSGPYDLACGSEAVVEACDAGELLFLLEKHITVALQRCRPDLLFFHAAALEHRGKVYLLAADSGQGKSTTSWGLLHHGFRYLSDELAPIDLQDLAVHAYPHALCLKRRPPPAFPLPATQVMDLGDTLHVPTPALPAATLTRPVGLAAVIFVGYRPELAAPQLRPIGAAEAAARLYVTALNPLAHPNRGLDAVAHIASQVPCYALDAADLGLTCALVRERFSTPQFATTEG